MYEIEDKVDGTIDMMDKFLQKHDVELAVDELDDMRDLLQGILEVREEEM